jgi:bacterioferritin-associated ferredoxin
LAAVIPRAIIREIRPIQPASMAAEATSGAAGAQPILGEAEEAVTEAAAAVAINAASAEKPRHMIRPNRTILDSFQFASLHGPVWNHLKSGFFLLRRITILNIDGCASPKGSSVFMIVCSCNVLSDHDVRDAVNTSEDLPRNAKQLYGCLGCSAECGRCARTIKTIIDEALGACAETCRSGCPHSRTGKDAHVHDEFSLAAS